MGIAAEITEILDDFADDVSLLSLPVAEYLLIRTVKEAEAHAKDLSFVHSVRDNHAEIWRDYLAQYPLETKALLEGGETAAFYARLENTAYQARQMKKYLVDYFTKREKHGVERRDGRIPRPLPIAKEDLTIEIDDWLELAKENAWYLSNGGIGDGSHHGMKILAPAKEGLRREIGLCGNNDDAFTGHYLSALKSKYEVL